MRKKLKITKALIAVSFLIGIIAFVTPVLAAGSNRVLFMAIGDDLDINATNLIIGKIEGEELTSAKAVFYQKIYDESGEKVHSMLGILEDGLLLTPYFYFYCPIFNVWFINVWFFMGAGIFMTTDTDYNLIYRKNFPITLPNTKGEYVQASMLMFLSPTAEYCLEDPSTPGEHPIFILPGGAWILVAVLWDVGIPMDVGFGYGILPIGPVNYLTKSWGI